MIRTVIRHTKRAARGGRKVPTPTQILECKGKEEKIEKDLN